MRYLCGRRLAENISQPTNERINERTNERTSEPTTKPRTYFFMRKKLAGKPANERTNEPTNQRANGRTNEPTKEPTNQRANEPTNERTNERANQRTSEQTNEQTNRTATQSMKYEVLFAESITENNSFDTTSTPDQGFDELFMHFVYIYFFSSCFEWEIDNELGQAPNPIRLFRRPRVRQSAVRTWGDDRPCPPSWV